VIAAAVVAAMMLTSAAAQGDVINVPGDHDTIQEAIDTAADGDEIVVADGTYTGPGNRDLDLAGKAITVRSSGGPQACVIDGGGVTRGFLFVSGEGAETRVEGFTVRNGAAAHGGAVYVSGASPLIIRCIFEGNAAGRGGAAYVTAASPAFVACRFTGNHADVVDGGAVYNIDGGHPTFSGCLFDANVAAVFGGAIFSDLCAFTMRNCTLSENVAERGGAVVNYAGVEMTLVNSIVWGNHATSGPGGYEAQILSTSSSETIDFCCVQDLDPDVGGQGNIDADPLLVDPDHGDFHISAGSPCIDAADNTAVPQDLTTDLDGNPRFVDDPKTQDTGHGDPPIVDMGTYEFQLPGSCPWDLNGDDLVGISDLLILLGAWGPNPGHPADINGDGFVGIGDLLALLANWGACS
jgi:predicted outer membrane repeat protein